MMCTTMLHGGVCHRTSTPHKSGNKMKEKKNLVITTFPSSFSRPVPCCLDIGVLAPLPLFLLEDGRSIPDPQPKTRSVGFVYIIGSLRHNHTVTFITVLTVLY